MNRKLQKELAPTLYQELGSSNADDLEELFRENEEIAIMRQQLESQRKVGSSLLDIMYFQLRTVIT